ncbi:MAG TPA: aspartate--tRNA ligase, partial [Thermoanaerobaculia bacterium]|nr:aspartate--tRNA ligase [Thermoanaerobaculia bacterium]
MNRTPAGSLRLTNAGESVTLAGWVQKQRDFGELIFIDLRDRSGVVQIVVDRERGADDALIAAAKELRGEFVVRVDGVVAERAPEVRNAKIPTGDVEVIASAIEVYNRAETPPFPIEDDVTAAEELRLKYRYLDLRRPSLGKNFVLRDRITFAIRDYMHRNGFLDIETPILTKSTPEGARDYLVPSRVHKGMWYALPQSPQIFKQLLQVAGMERYYQIARCFRDEDNRSDRQPEFTQIDIEASFIDEEFVYALIEGLFAEIFPLAGVPVTTPFPRMTWQEAMDRYGIDRPDTRFGMLLHEVKEPIAFPPFQEAESVRGFAVPGGASFSRKRLDDLVAAAKARGVTLAWIKLNDEKSSSIKKFLTPESITSIQRDLEANDGDLALLASGAEIKTLETLGDLRLRIANEEKLIPAETWNFLWVVGFPLLEWDEETQRYFARHHPFTSPRLDQVDKLESDPGAVLARAYDCVLNGLELGGGSIRINRTDLQQRMFRSLGIADEEARSRFGFLLDAFRYGAPPHAGFAFGIDRLTAILAGEDNIREVIAFPKTQSGADPLTGAPTEIDPAQLKELGLSVLPKPKK